MPATFAYKVRDREGRIVEGSIEADSSELVVNKLRSMGYVPVAIERADASALKKDVKLPFGGKVKQKDVAVFSRQFATMINSGLSLIRALHILEEQTESEKLRQTARSVRTDVERGASLAQALGRHPKVFNRLYVAMDEAGEAAGILDVVLDRAALQIEKETKIKRRVKGAMLYPTMVLLFATVVLIGMLLFLVPIFTKIFADLGGELPMLTQWVVNASDFLRGNWYIVFPVLGAAAFGLRRYKRTEHGRRNWDRLRLRIPMRIGDTVLKVTLARFSRTLSTLVAAGVDIIKALEITGQTAGNWVIEEALADVRERVHSGAPIAQPLVENPVFPPMVSQMVKIGEETGELEKMLGKIADFYEDEVDSAISSLTSIIEPLMMIGVGLMVGVIIISMYLPMFKMLSLVK